MTVTITISLVGCLNATDKLFYAFYMNISFSSICTRARVCVVCVWFKRFEVFFFSYSSSVLRGALLQETVVVPISQSSSSLCGFSVFAFSLSYVLYSFTWVLVCRPLFVLERTWRWAVSRNVLSVHVHRIIGRLVARGCVLFRGGGGRVAAARAGRVAMI